MSISNNDELAGKKKKNLEYKHTYNCNKKIKI